MTQFPRDQASDSGEVVTPFMQDGTYPSRNFATLGPLPDSRRVVPKFSGYILTVSPSITSRIGDEERRVMHLVPAPAVKLMKSRVLSRPGMKKCLGCHAGASSHFIPGLEGKPISWDEVVAGMREESSREDTFHGSCKPIFNPLQEKNTAHGITPSR